VNSRFESVEPHLATLHHVVSALRTELDSVESNLRFTPVIKELQGVGTALNSEMDALTSQLGSVFQLYRSLIGSSVSPGGLLEERLSSLELNIPLPRVLSVVVPWIRLSIESLC